jgi:hypothetical protein
MSALSDDRPRFEEIPEDERARVAEEYRRIWGEDLPERAQRSDDGDVPPATS